MFFAEVVIYGGLGLIFGSFLNVFILRHGTGRGVNGRSGCLSCGHVLAWYELIPVVSWIIQRGRCRHCASSISVQYPLVELTTALLFIALGVAGLSPALFLIGATIASLLIAIAVYDMRHTIIPDAWTYLFTACAIVFVCLERGVHVDTLYFITAGAGATLLPLWLLWRLSGGAWMGYGDVKLSLGIGVMLGMGGGVTALFLAFVLGALIGVFILLPLPQLMKLVHILRGQRLRGSAAHYTMKSEVPFGPFLVLGFLIVWLTNLYGYALPLVIGFTA